jgi:XTP/dITP diphosphohydrolase
VKLLIATSNSGKLNEFKHTLKGTGFDFLSPAEAGISKSFKVAETGATFKANAVLKAKAYANESGLMTLADDTGLIVDALDGKPGVFSRRYGPTAQKRNKKLLTQMQTITDRSARFESVVALFNPKTKILKTFTGKSEGHILSQPSTGKHGFGYDPIFFFADLNKSFAQATIKEKNRVSHRGQALTKALKFLIRYNSPPDENNR